MPRKKSVYVLPEFWSGVLINEDRYTAFDSDRDERKFNRWLKLADPGHCVAVSSNEDFAPDEPIEGFFCWHHDASEVGIPGCNCLYYLFWKEE